MKRRASKDEKDKSASQEKREIGMRGENERKERREYVKLKREIGREREGERERASMVHP